MKRIQIHLTHKKLDDVVREMSEAAVRCFENRTSSTDDLAGRVNASLREVLEKYVHAYDLCGLSTYCHEASEVDPWDVKDQDED